MDAGTAVPGCDGLFCWCLLSVIAALDKKAIRTHSLGATHLVRSYMSKMKCKKFVSIGNTRSLRSLVLVAQ